MNITGLGAQVNTYILIGFFAVIGLFALMGLAHGFKKSIYRWITFAVYLLIVYFLADVISSALFDVSIAQYVGGLGLPSYITGDTVKEMATSAATHFIGSDASEQAVKMALALASLIVRFVYFILMVTVVYFIYWFITQLIWLIFVKGKQKKDENGKKVSKKRLLGALLGGVKGAVIYCLMCIVVINGIIGMVPSTKAAEGSSSTSNLSTGQNESSDSLLSAYLDPATIKEITDFVDGYKESMFFTLFNGDGSEQSINNTINSFIWTGKYDDYEIKVRDEIMVLGKLGLSGYQLYQGLSGEEIDIDYEGVSELVKGLADSQFIMDLLPIAVKAATNLDQVKTLIEEKNLDVSALTGMTTENWKTDIGKLGDLVLDLEPVIDNLTQQGIGGENGTDISSLNFGDISSSSIRKVFTTLSAVGFITKAMDIAVTYALTLDSVKEKIGSLSLDLDEIVWSDEISNIGDIVGGFLDLGIDTFAEVKDDFKATINKLDFGDVTDETSHGKVGDLIASIFASNFVNQIFANVMENVVYPMIPEDYQSMFNFEKINEKGWINEFNSLLDIFKYARGTGTDPAVFFTTDGAINFNILKNLNASTILNSDLLTNAVVQMLSQAKKGQGIAQSLSSTIVIPDVFDDTDDSGEDLYKWKETVINKYIASEKITVGETTYKKYNTINLTTYNALTTEQKAKFKPGYKIVGGELYKIVDGLKCIIDFMDLSDFSSDMFSSLLSQDTINNLTDPNSNDPTKTNIDVILGSDILRCTLSGVIGDAVDSISIPAAATTQYLVTPYTGGVKGTAVSKNVITSDEIKSVVVALSKLDIIGEKYVCTTAVTFNGNSYNVDDEITKEVYDANPNYQSYFKSSVNIKADVSLLETLLDEEYVCKTAFEIEHNTSYAVNDVISKSTYNELTAEQKGKFTASYKCETAFDTYAVGARINQTTYDALDSESKAKFKLDYVCSTAVVIPNPTKYAVGDVISQKVYDSLTVEQQGKFANGSYICIKAGTYGGNAYTLGQVINKAGYLLLSTAERTNFKNSYNKLEYITGSSDSAVAGSLVLKATISKFIIDFSDDGTIVVPDSGTGSVVELTTDMNGENIKIVTSSELKAMVTAAVKMDIIGDVYKCTVAGTYGGHTYAIDDEIKEADYNVLSASEKANFKSEVSVKADMSLLTGLLDSADSEGHTKLDYITGKEAEGSIPALNGSKILLATLSKYIIEQGDADTIRIPNTTQVIAIIGGKTVITSGELNAMVTAVVKLDLLNDNNEINADMGLLTSLLDYEYTCNTAIADTYAVGDVISQDAYNLLSSTNKAKFTRSNYTKLDYITGKEAEGAIPAINGSKILNATISKYVLEAGDGSDATIKIPTTSEVIDVASYKCTVGGTYDGHVYAVNSVIDLETYNTLSTANKANFTEIYTQSQFNSDPAVNKTFKTLTGGELKSLVTAVIKLDIMKNTYKCTVGGTYNGVVYAADDEITESIYNGLSETEKTKFEKKSDINADMGLLTSLLDVTDAETNTTKIDYICGKGTTIRGSKILLATISKYILDEDDTGTIIVPTSVTLRYGEYDVVSSNELKSLVTAIIKLDIMGENNKINADIGLLSSLLDYEYVCNTAGTYAGDTYVVGQVIDQATYDVFGTADRFKFTRSNYNKLDYITGKEADGAIPSISGTKILNATVSKYVFDIGEGGSSSIKIPVVEDVIETTAYKCQTSGTYNGVVYAVNDLIDSATYASLSVTEKTAFSMVIIQKSYSNKDYMTLTPQELKSLVTGVVKLDIMVKKYTCTTAGTYGGHAYLVNDVINATTYNTLNDTEKNNFEEDSDIDADMGLLTSLLDKPEGDSNTKIDYICGNAEVRGSGILLTTISKYVIDEDATETIIVPKDVTLTYGGFTVLTNVELKALVTAIIKLDVMDENDDINADVGLLTSLLDYEYTCNVAGTYSGVSYSSGQVIDQATYDGLDSVDQVNFIRSNYNKLDYITGKPAAGLVAELKGSSIMKATVSKYIVNEGSGTGSLVVPTYDEVLIISNYKCSVGGTYGGITYAVNETISAANYNTLSVSDKANFVPIYTKSVSDRNIQELTNEEMKSVVTGVIKLDIMGTTYTCNVAGTYGGHTYAVDDEISESDYNALSASDKGKFTKDSNVNAGLSLVKTLLDVPAGDTHTKIDYICGVDDGLGGWTIYPSYILTATISKYVLEQADSDTIVVPLNDVEYLSLSKSLEPDEMKAMISGVIKLEIITDYKCVTAFTATGSGASYAVNDYITRGEYNAFTSAEKAKCSEETNFNAGVSMIGDMLKLADSEENTRLDYIVGNGSSLLGSNILKATVSKYIIEQSQVDGGSGTLMIPNNVYTSVDKYVPSGSDTTKQLANGELKALVTSIVKLGIVDGENIKAGLNTVSSMNEYYEYEVGERTAAMISANDFQDTNEVIDYVIGTPSITGSDIMRATISKYIAQQKNSISIFSYVSETLGTDHIPALVKTEMKDLISAINTLEIIVSYNYTGSSSSYYVVKTAFSTHEVGDYISSADYASLATTDQTKCIARTIATNDKASEKTYNKLRALAGFNSADFTPITDSINAIDNITTLILSDATYQNAASKSIILRSTITSNIKTALYASREMPQDALNYRCKEAIGIYQVDDLISYETYCGLTSEYQTKFSVESYEYICNSVTGSYEVGDAISKATYDAMNSTQQAKFTKNYIMSMEETNSVFAALNLLGVTSFSSTNVGLGTILNLLTSTNYDGVHKDIEIVLDSVVLWDETSLKIETVSSDDGDPSTDDSLFENINYDDGVAYRGSDWKCLVAASPYEVGDTVNPADYISNIKGTALATNFAQILTLAYDIELYDNLGYERLSAPEIIKILTTLDVISSSSPGDEFTISQSDMENICNNPTIVSAAMTDSVLMTCSVSRLTQRAIDSAFSSSAFSATTTQAKNRISTIDNDKAQWKTYAATVYPDGTDKTDNDDGQLEKLLKALKAMKSFTNLSNIKTSTKAENRANLLLIDDSYAMRIAITEFPGITSYPYNYSVSASDSAREASIDAYLNTLYMS